MRVPVFLRENKENNKGFTLLELLVALGIISISFMAILPLLWNTIHVNKSISTGARAKDLAVEQVEALMSQPRDVFDAAPYNLATNVSYTSPPVSLSMSGATPTASDPAVFTRTFSINQVPGVTADPKPIVLTAVVQYTYKGESKSRSFTTMWSF